MYVYTIGNLWICQGGIEKLTPLSQKNKIITTLTLTKKLLPKCKPLEQPQ